ncbi:DUF177 domain-containing protein [Euzebya sp.]|uniref:YceD family protein n=1 Tax=Euzebya sp. TaxID=1971409 RepID=UPI003519A665
MSTEQHELSPTRLDVSDLIDSPGASRQVDLDVPLPAGFEVPLTRFGDEVGVTGVLESLVDGVLLRGSFEVDVAQSCAACLEPIDPHVLTADVAELYGDPADADDPDDVEQGFEIVDGVIDIDPAIRDALAQVTPAAPKCRPDCAGLCPTCGANLNTTTCDCVDEVVDDRWAALADLEINP